MKNRLKLMTLDELHAERAERKNPKVIALIDKQLGHLGENLLAINYPIHAGRYYVFAGEVKISNKTGRTQDWECPIHRCDMEKRGLLEYA